MPETVLLTGTVKVTMSGSTLPGAVSHPWKWTGSLGIAPGPACVPAWHEALAALDPMDGLHHARLSVCCPGMEVVRLRVLACTWCTTDKRGCRSWRSARRDGTGRGWPRVRRRSGAVGTQSRPLAVPWSILLTRPVDLIRDRFLLQGKDWLFTVVTVGTGNGREVLAVPTWDVPLVRLALEIASAEAPWALGNSNLEGRPAGSRRPALLRRDRDRSRRDGQFDSLSPCHTRTASAGPGAFHARARSRIQPRWVADYPAVVLRGSRLRAVAAAGARPVGTAGPGRDGGRVVLAVFGMWLRADMAARGISRTTVNGWYRERAGDRSRQASVTDGVA